MYNSYCERREEVKSESAMTKLLNILKRVQKRESSKVSDRTDIHTDKKLRMNER